MRAASALDRLRPGSHLPSRTGAILTTGPGINDAASTQAPSASRSEAVSKRRSEPAQEQPVELRSGLKISAERVENAGLRP